MIHFFKNILFRTSKKPASRVSCCEEPAEPTQGKTSASAPAKKRFDILLWIGVWFVGVGCLLADLR